MPKSHPPYSPEFRQRIVELVRKGRTREELARQFAPSAQTIRNWAKQAAVDAGERTDGLTTEEGDELRRLRREVRQLREERAILSKAAAWFARETNTIPSTPGRPSDRHRVPRLGCHPQRVLRVARARIVDAGAGRCEAERGDSGGRGHGGEILRAVLAEVRAFREILTEQSVGVLIRAALPRALRIAEIDRQACVDAQPRMPSHFCALVPRQRAAQIFRQRRDRSGNRVTDGFRSVPGECGTVLDPKPFGVSAHARQMQQHREARRALDQGADRGAVQPEDQITLPMPGNRAVLGFGRALGDHELGVHERLATRFRARPRDPQCAAGRKQATSSRRSAPRPCT